MPCFSRIKTQIKNQENLEQALTALGYGIEKRGETVLAKRSGSSDILFERVQGVYTASTSAGLQAIQKKYAEITVRSWARKTGHLVESFDGSRMVLVKRG